jgi:hypothetical protein
MTDNRLKEKIREVLRQNLFGDPSDVIDVSDGDDPDDLHLVVISPKLEGHRLGEKNDLIWDELTRGLTPEEWGKISLTIGLTPAQVNGSTIEEIKTR